MSPWRVAGTALATIVLAGCMIGPNYERAAPSLPASYPDVPPATATSAAAPVVRPDWWMLYGDATLDHLVATALSDNLDVEVPMVRSPDNFQIVVAGGDNYKAMVVPGGNKTVTRLIED